MATELSPVHGVDLDEAGLGPDNSPIISVSIAEEEAPAMGVDLTGQYASWNYFQSVDNATNKKFIEAFQAEYGKAAGAGLLLHTGNTVEWLAPGVLAAPWWRVL